MCVQVYKHTYVGTLVHVCMCMWKSEDKLRYHSSGVALSWNMANEIQDLFLFLCLAFQGWDYNPSQPSFSTWVWESGSFVGHALYQCTISQSQINFFLMISISHRIFSRLTVTLSRGTLSSSSCESLSIPDIEAVRPILLTPGIHF